MAVCINGEFFEDCEAKVSAFDRGFLFGDGAFTTLRTRNGKLFRIDDYLDRLFGSCELIELRIPRTKEQIISWTEECFRRSELQEARIRIQVTRGTGAPEVAQPLEGEPTIAIFAVPLPEYKPELYEKGAEVINVRIERFLPRSKNLAFLPSVLADIRAREKNAFEPLLIDRQDFATEGKTSNLFIVKDGELITPKENILEGVTRKVVLELAEKEGIRTELRAVKMAELFTADEVFITGTTKAIVPVVKIDGKTIASGTPGETTKHLMRKFGEYVGNY
ncbi:MAG: aminotransferase class IV [Candidatus Diapherotrites archaeon]